MPEPVDMRPASVAGAPPRYVKDVVHLAFPVLITDLAGFGRILAATYFVAQLGVAPLAMLAVAASVIATVTAISNGLFTGTGILTARSQQEPRQMARCFYNSLLAGLVMGVLLFCFLWNFRGIAELLHLPIHFEAAASRAYGEGTSSAPTFDAFMKVYALGVIPFSMAGSLRFYLLGAQRPLFISVSNIIGLVLCGGFTYVLVLGRWGFPALGLAGFAWASVIAFWVVLVVLVVHVICIRRQLHLGALPGSRALSGRMMVQMLRLGGPRSVMVGAEFTFLTVIVFLMSADYGVEDTAGYQVILQVIALGSAWSMSVGQAITVLASRSTHDRAINVAELFRRAEGLSLISNVAICGFWFLAHHWILSLFLNSEVTITAASQFLWAAAVLVLLEAFRSNGFSLLRGLGYTVSPMLVLIGAYAIVGLGLLALVRYVVHVPAQGLVYVLAVCNAVAALCYAFIIRRVPEYRAAKARVRASGGGTTGTGATGG